MFAGVVMAAAPRASAFPCCGEQSQNSPAQQVPAAQPSPAAEDANSVAAAARRSKAEKTKTAKKVITEDDLPARPQETAAAVEEEKKSTVEEATEAAKSAKPAESQEPKPGGKTEAEWRASFQQLRDQITALDKQIAQLNEIIAKGGAYGTINPVIDPSAPPGSSAVYLVDRRTEVKKLEERKAILQKKLDDLDEEARKASVPTQWIH